MTPSERDVARSLRYSVLDGMFWALMVGVGETYLPAYAILMAARPIELALLTALPIFLGYATQLFGAAIAPRLGGRKPFVVSTALLHALAWAPIAAVYSLDGNRAAVLIAVVVAYWCFGSVHGAAWASWMGDLVPAVRRGEYFGFRNRVLQTALFVGLVAGGLVLQLFEAKGDRYSGFATIFVLALLFRSASSFCLSRQIEPVPDTDGDRPRRRGGIGALLREIRATHAGLVIVYVAATNLGIFVATPFFVAYMLEDLRFGYGTLTLVLGAGALGKFVFAPVWGKYSDRFGARKVLVLTGFLTPAIPLLWLFGSSVPYLLLIQAFSGFAMGGFELCAFTMLLDATPRRRRERLLAYYGLVNGFFTFLGAIAGAVLAWNSSDLVLLRQWEHASRYFLPFLVSGLVRILAALAFVPRLRDVRAVEPIRYRDLLLRVVTIRPTQGAMQQPEIIVGTRDDSFGADREREGE